MRRAATKSETQGPAIVEVISATLAASAGARRDLLTAQDILRPYRAARLTTTPCDPALAAAVFANGAA